MENSDNVLVSEMMDNSIQLHDEEGVVIDLPIIGMFTVNKKYYVVVFVKGDEKKPDGEQLMLRVEREDDREYVQMIIDRDEWETAISTWQKIVDKIGKDGVTPVMGQ